LRPVALPPNRSFDNQRKGAQRANLCPTEITYPIFHDDRPSTRVHAIRLSGPVWRPPRNYESE
jgi:hypothetical protein